MKDVIEGALADAPPQAANGNSSSGALVTYADAARMVQFAQLRDKLGSFEEVDTTAILHMLPNLEDDHLLQIAQAATIAYNCAWKIRGACGYHIQQRLTTRLSGGRGRKDETGEGVKSQMVRWAKSVGVEYQTLMLDIRLYETYETGHLQITSLETPDSRIRSLETGAVDGSSLEIGHLQMTNLEVSTTISPLATRTDHINGLRLATDPATGEVDRQKAKEYVNECADTRAAGVSGKQCPHCAGSGQAV